MQLAEPFVGAVQRLHVRPHDVDDVELLSMHVPLQLWKPAGQAHTLAWHVIPPAHAVPQTPQWLGSEERSTHVAAVPVPHRVCPVGHLQTPATHVSVDTQALPQAPQFVRLVCVFTQTGGVPHTWPELMDAQATHDPLTQLELLSHFLPQLPQLFESDVSSTHALPVPASVGHVTSLPGHAHPASTHEAPDAQTFPQAPQLSGSVAA